MKSISNLVVTVLSYLVALMTPSFLLKDQARNSATTFVPKGHLFAFLASSLFLVSAAMGQATVTTDKDDYAPGEYVIITGTGWQPGETVSFHFDETPKPATCVNPHDLVAVADANGNIYNNQFLIKLNHLGVSFLLTATGETSGFVAYRTFTDGNVGFGQSGIPGQNIDVTATVTYTKATTNIVVTETITFKTNGTETVGAKDGTTITWVFNPVTTDGITYNWTGVSTYTQGFNIGSSNFTGSNAIIGTYSSTNATNLAVGNATGTYGGTASLTATLTSGTTNLSGKSIDFFLNGTSVGTATTNAGGIATINNVSLSGINAGTYTTGVSASFTADANYAGSNGTGSLTVNKKEITGNFTADNKVYDGNASATVLTRTLNGILGTDAVTLTGGTATFNDKTVADGKTVTLAGASLAGADAGNYSLTSVATTTANITALAITGNFTADNKVYDGNASATVLTRTLTGVLGTDVVTLTGGTATFNDKNVANSKTVTLAGASLTGADAGNYSLTSVATTTANITALAITGNFTADNKVYDGNASATVLTRTLNGVLGTDAVTLTGGTATFNDKTVANGKTVTLAGASLTGADAGNYSLTSVATTTANITALAITGNFTADNKVYDGNASATVLTRTLNGVLGTDAVTLTGGTATFNDKTVATGKTVTLAGASLAGADAGNYSLTSVATTTANITALAITGNFTADNKVYDGNASAVVLTRTLNGVLGTDAVTLTGGTATFNDKTVADGKTVTLAGASLAGADAGNYSLTSVATTTANITALAITGNFTADNKVYDGNASATVLTRTLNGVLGTDAVTLTGGTATFNDKTVANGKTVTLAGASLTGADAGNYSLTSVATTTANITALAITGNFTADNKVYDGNASATVLTRTLNGVLGTDAVTLTGGTATFNDKTVANGKTVTLAGASLAGADAGNYSITSVATTTANITALAITGNFTADNKVYDGNASAVVLTRTLNGVLGTDAVTLTGGTATFNDKTVANGKTVTLAGASLAGADAGNYSLTSVATTTANITALAITGNFTADNKVYDGNASATVLTRTLTGVLGTDVVTLTGGTATFNDKNVANSKTVTLAGASLTGADAGNYSLTSVATTTANITALAITGNFTADNKVYDGNASATVLTRTLNGVLGTDAVTLTGGTATFNDKTVANGKTVTLAGASLAGASLAGADAGNYSLTSVATTTANITALEITGNFTADNKVYDGNASATVLTRTLNGVLGTDALTLTGGTATFNDKTVANGKTVTLAGASLTGADAGNYSLTSVATTTANITALAITGNFTADNKVYDGNASATVLTRTLNGVLGTDAVTLTGGTATFNDKTVANGKTVTLAGASLAGTDAGNYSLTSVATTTANITALAITGNFTADNKVYDGNASATVLTRTLNGVLGTDAVTLTGGTATFNDKTVANGKTVTLAGASLTGADAGNYSLTSVATTTANITALAITGNFTADNKVYDGNASATVLTRTLNGVLGTDAVTLTGGTATFNDKTVADGKTVTLAGASLTGADAGNYSLTSVGTTTANITVRPLTITATGINKIYDGNTTATVTLNDNRVAGDVFTTAYTAANFANANVGTWDVFVTGISIGGTEAGNYNLLNTTASTTAEITAASTTTALITSAATVRIHDYLTMTANITPENTASPLTGTVEFKIGNIVYGSVAVVPVPGSVTGMVQATLIPQVTNLPANYTVIATFTSTNANYSGSQNSKALEVKQREASPYNDEIGFYTGTLFAWTTGPNSSTATVALTTTIKDLNAPRGDLRGAKVTFYLVNGTSMTPISSAQNLPVGLVDINDGSVGTASAIVQLNIGSSSAQDFKIAVGISGTYYNAPNSGDAQSIITISKPVPGGYMVTGGKIRNANSWGYIKGHPGKRTDFQTDISYTKSGTNPKGKATVMIRSFYKSDGTLGTYLRTYIITTNAIASLNIGNTPNPVSATFSAKANLVEQLLDGSTVAIEGGSTFNMVVYKNASGACEQKVAITLYRKAGGIWFSSNWNGTATILQDLSEGEVSIPGASNCNPAAPDFTTSVSRSTNAVTDEAEEVQAPGKFKVEVYPTISTTDFKIKVASESNELVSIRIYDQNGKTITNLGKLNKAAIVTVGNEFRGGIYFAEVRQGNNRKVVKLIKVN